jgi:hypothetical protein
VGRLRERGLALEGLGLEEGSGELGELRAQGDAFAAAGGQDRARQQVDDQPPPLDGPVLRTPQAYREHGAAT